MVNYKVDFTQTGWQEIPADTVNIVAHYKDGAKKVFALWEFVALGKREQKNIVEIDCYNESEQIPE